MDYEKYSKQKFDSLGLNSVDARKLADELRKDVAAEIHDAVLVAFSQVIERLNSQGHNLRSDEIDIGDIGFRDESVEEACHLRLACDVVISAGYSHLWQPQEK
jgi:hypothetical protein